MNTNMPVDKQNQAEDTMGPEEDLTEAEEADHEDLP